MINIIIGNILAFIGSVLLVYSGIIKEKKKIIYVQTLQIGVLIISNAVLGGVTGTIINTVDCIRNILCYKNKLKFKEKVILIIISTALSVKFNNLGIVGMLPLISTILYTLLMDTKNIIKLKIVLIVTSILWCVYGLIIKSYSSAIFNILNIITNSISIYQLCNSKNVKEG